MTTNIFVDLDLGESRTLDEDGMPAGEDLLLMTAASDSVQIPPTHNGPNQQQIKRLISTIEFIVCAFHEYAD